MGISKTELLKQKIYKISHNGRQGMFASLSSLLRKPPCATRFIQASGDILPIATQTIDVIISNGCLHLLNKSKAFAEFYRVFRSNGRAVLADVVAEDDRIENFYDNPLTYLYSGGGKQTPEQYESLAKEAGFSEVQFISERQPGKSEMNRCPADI